MGVLFRHSSPRGTWIETGTYFGDTTFKLGQAGATVYSIEADSVLAKKAQARFQRYQNISVLEGDSAALLGGLLETIQGPVNFWLDGHFSGGITHQADVDTPIRSELDSIQRNCQSLGEIAVLIDDFRCFTSTHAEYSDYPDQNFLVDWAQSMGLWWTVEHDIFVAKSQTLV